MYSGSWFGKENSTTGKAPWQMGAEATSHQDRTGSREESQPARPGSKQSRHTLNDPLPPPNGPTTSPNSITCWGVHVPTQEPMGAGDILQPNCTNQGGKRWGPAGRRGGEGDCLPELLHRGSQRVRMRKHLPSWDCY